MGIQAQTRRRGRPPVAHAEHRRVASELRDRIVAGRWKPKEVLPSISALTREFASSESAVRLALKMLARENRIAPSARRRWLVSHPHLPSMDGKGIILEVMNTPMGAETPGAWFMEIQRGVMEGCGRLKAPLLIAHSYSLQDAQPEGFPDLPLKGILLFGRFTRQNLRAYENLPVPVCSVDTPIEPHRLHSACVDNRAAAHDATRRLIEAGHRRIAFVRFVLYTIRDVDTDSKERQAGFISACEEARLGSTSGNIFNHLPIRSAQHSLRALLRARPRYTAALCVDPACAKMLEREAVAAGLEVPRDLTIVCFQGQGEKVPYSGPAIDFYEIALRATQLLDRPKLPAIHERVPTLWRERGSGSLARPSI